MNKVDTARRDAEAVEAYERMLRTAPAATIEKAHVEAFEKLTPEQLDVLYQRFLEHAESDDRPTDARPASLARSAAQVETREPGRLKKVIGDGWFGAEMNAWLGYELLCTIAYTTLAASAWQSWASIDGADAAASTEAGGQEYVATEPVDPGIGDMGGGFWDFWF